MGNRGSKKKKSEVQKNGPANEELILESATEGLEEESQSVLKVCDQMKCHN